MKKLLLLSLLSLSTSYAQTLDQALKSYAYPQGNLCKVIQFSNPNYGSGTSYKFPVPVYFAQIKFNGLVSDYGFNVSLGKLTSLGQGYHELFYPPIEVRDDYLNVYLREIDRDNTEICIVKFKEI